MNVNSPSLEESGLGAHTEDILDGIEKVKAVASLVESAIIWRAQYIAWNVDIFKAESLLFRLIFKEGSQNPQALDLLARIYFQQSKYEKARDLWTRALALQPGNPALRRTSMAMQSIAKSPTSAVLKHKFGMFLNLILMVLIICVAGIGTVRGYGTVMRWADGTPAMHNLTGRFHYEIDSVTRDMVYVPSMVTVAAHTDEIVPAAGAEDGAYNIGFTRKKIADGKEMGRIEVVVERSGNTLKASGRIPNLYVRYLVEESLWNIPGITELDLRGLVVDRSYRVNSGDSLWIIARKVYGQGSAWTLLAKANDLNDPNKLRIGQELSLPLGDEVLIPQN
jgi:tetratricopeptide (TPR) repeat protein